MDKEITYCVRIVFVDGSSTDLYVNNEIESQKLVDRVVEAINNRCAVKVHHKLILNPNSILYVEVQE